VMIDLEVLLHRLHAGLGGAIDDEGAEEEPVAKSRLPLEPLEDEPPHADNKLIGTSIARI
jgi:hypothetical protein